MFYAIAPAHITSGGPELLHQLVYELNSLGIKAMIAYDCSKTNIPAAVPLPYKRYVNTFTTLDKVPDTKSSCIIVPETRPFLIREFKQARTIFWWLSVDFFRIHCDPAFKREKQGIPQSIKATIFQTKKKAFQSIKKATVHLYQSEFAKNYAIQNGIERSVLFKLSDYINDDYRIGIDHLSFINRKPNVLYNPKKGYEYTSQLIKLSPDINWIPLQGYTNQQLTSLMHESMLYIDFGSHPGKDRLPREAAACGDCVITGKHGAAAYEKDYPLPAWASIDQDQCNKLDVIKTIKHVLNNYESAVTEYAPYRNMIQGEKDEFKKDLNAVIDYLMKLD